MAICAPSRARLLRAALLVSTALAAFASLPASAKVGVTSGADGDPLGKPPNENERVLRIGIDVQANELITTNAKDRAHLVFLDGSALTVGPNARLTIDKFVFDPSTGNGELAVNASVGVLRFVGGKISKKGNVTVTTPSSTIGIRGGIVLVAVTQVKTTADFLFGTSMTSTAAGITQTAIRPGSQIITNLGGPPSSPTLMKAGSLNAALGQLEGSSSSSGSGGSGSGGGGGGNADQKAQSSGFSNSNSGQSPGTVVNVTPNLPPNTSNNALTNAVNNSTAAASLTSVTLANPPQKQTASSTPTPSPTSTPSPTPSPSPSPSPTPQPPPPIVVVTNGRFLQDPPYVPTTVNAHKLTAKPNPANNQPLMPTGLVNTALDGSQTVTLTLQNASIPPQVFQLPWIPGKLFSFTASTPLGNVNGVGVVDPQGQFFAYSMNGANNLKFGVFGGEPTLAANFPKSTAGQSPAASAGTAHPPTIGAQQLINAATPGNIPFTPDSVGGDAQLQAAAKTSPLYTVYGEKPSQSKSLQVTISIAGTGASQKSYMGVFIANYGVIPGATSADGSLYSTGTYAGSYRLGADQGAGSLRSTEATAPTGQGQGTAIYGSTGQYMVYVPDRIVQRTGRDDTGATQAKLGREPQPAQRVNGVSINQTANGTQYSYYPVTIAAPATSDQVNPNVGQNRTAQTQMGYVAGLVETSKGRVFVPDVLVAKPSDVRITTDPATNQALARVVLRGYDGSVFDPNLVLKLGGGSNQFGPTSAFIDNNTYAMTSNGHSTLHLGEHSYKVQNAMLASANTASVQLPNMSSCTCAYLTWGWWSASAKAKNGDIAGVNLGTYVAGTLTTAIQMPPNGQATYNGSMVGNVNNAGNSYIAGGNYSMSYDYGKRDGQTLLTFDKMNYKGSVSSPANGPGTNFSGGFNNGPNSGTMKGSFYGPGAANQGGSFSIGTNNTPYKASGSFMGQK
ncbi:MAG: FecR domain-containing protein [Alphaproteobacteria bacterium]|nr:FecR domain-containing protein [Alphaproteobacteria bacterium]